MKRRALIAGNWKMHATLEEAGRLAAGVAAACRGLEDRDVLVAPPFTALAHVAGVVKGVPLLLAGQNVHWEEKGAFTGEVSPAMLRDAGAVAALVGHSERRQLFLEDDGLINRRLRGALAGGLLPVFCIGETLAEREAGDTFAVLDRQLRAGLAGVSLASGQEVVLAYEPVWAIGTGRTASDRQAQEVHGFLRERLVEMFEKNIAARMRILYGGSVKPDNIDGLMRMEDIDGVLVGGASLDAQSFSRIIHFQASA